MSDEFHIATDLKVVNSILEIIKDVSYTSTVTTIKALSDLVVSLLSNIDKLYTENIDKVHVILLQYSYLELLQTCRNASFNLSKVLQTQINDKLNLILTKLSIYVDKQYSIIPHKYKCDSNEPNIIKAVSNFNSLPDKIKQIDIIIMAYKLIYEEYYHEFCKEKNRELIKTKEEYEEHLNYCTQYIDNHKHLVKIEYNVL
jgi:hypothetical protein